MARPEKVAVVDEIAEKIKRTQSLFLTDFTGLDVGSINKLRLLLRENSVEYVVVKNTLARLAADKAGREDLRPYLAGPTALAFGYEDPALPAKLLSAFAQKTGKPSVKAILFEGQIFGQEAMDRITELRSREELLIQMVSGLKAPITQVLTVLGGLLRNFMGLLEAISQAKGEEEGKGERMSSDEKVEKKEEGKIEGKAEIKEEAKVEEKADTEAKKQAKKEIVVKNDDKVELEAEVKTEKKAEPKAEEKAEEMQKQEQKPIEEMQQKLAEGKPSETEHKSHEAKAADPQKPKMKQSLEKEPENKKQ